MFFQSWCTDCYRFCTFHCSQLFRHHFKPHWDFVYDTNKTQLIFADGNWLCLLCVEFFDFWFHLLKQFFAERLVFSKKDYFFSKEGHDLPQNLVDAKGLGSWLSWIIFWQKQVDPDDSSYKSIQGTNIQIPVMITLKSQNGHWGRDSCYFYFNE